MDRFILAKLEEKNLVPNPAVSKEKRIRRAYYDLWGVPPPGSGPEHAWHGLGFFKAEYGGDEVAYAGAWVLVLSSAGARLIDIEKRARRGIRGLKHNIS